MPVQVNQPPPPPDLFQELAMVIDRLIRKGPGSTHARVRRVADILRALAKENYEAGQSAVVVTVVDTNQQEKS